MSFLGNLTEEKFIKEYWEKKPLLIKGAVKDIESYATSDDLKELSMDEDFESRIVYNDQEISVKHGPLAGSDFDKTGWTLVCHNLNLLDESFYNLQSKLSFLPDWLFDDVMATHSQSDATIGAHIDKYNVFILQGSGTRKWELQTNPDPTYIEGIDVKILKNFSPEIEWILEPGDMIYIPSNTAHRGTSLTESISYSLGFKSLENEIIFKNYLSEFAQNYESDLYLKDTTKAPVTDPYLIPGVVTDHFYEELKKITNNKEQFSMWMTSFLSTPRGPIEPGETYLEEEIKELSKSNSICKDVFTKIAVTQRDNDYAVAINNQLYSLSAHSYSLVKDWFEGPRLDSVKIDFTRLDNESWPLLIDLFKTGSFYFEALDN
jgi:50S ribosomal protein L16 3-hydroxylase